MILWVSGSVGDVQILQSKSFLKLYCDFGSGWLGRNVAIPAYSFPFNSRYSDLSWIIEQQLFLSRKFPYLQNEQN